jgi:hypothetical protein
MPPSRGSGLASTSNLSFCLDSFTCNNEVIESLLTDRDRMKLI